MPFPVWFRQEISRFLRQWRQSRLTEKQLNEWLDTPVGRLDTPLPGGAPLALAANGSLLANFFNQVQLAVSGADISVTSLSNQVSDFPQNVTIRAIICAYAFPNTLKTIRVTRKVLMSALERSMAYFDFAPDGSLCVSRAFWSRLSSISTTTTLQILPSRQI